VKRKMDRLDQRLGDFAPLQRPINELDVERLLDRYGIALVCDYPQLLFERQEGLLLPGWRYRDALHEYPRFTYIWPKHPDEMQSASERGAFSQTRRNPPDRLLGRLSDAYQVLDEIYAPVQRTSRPRQSSSGYRAKVDAHYS